MKPSVGELQVAITKWNKNQDAQKPSKGDGKKKSGKKTKGSETLPIGDYKGLMHKLSGVEPRDDVLANLQSRFGPGLSFPQIMEACNAHFAPLVPNISLQDRDLIKRGIVETSVWQNEHKIRSVLLDAMFHIVRTDYPEKYPSLLQDITRNINSNEEQRVYTGLCCLKVLVQRYKYKNAELRGDMNHIIDTTFRKLLEIASVCFTNARTASEYYFPMLHMICKIFHSAIQISLVQNLATQQALQPWVELCIAVTNLPFPDEHKSRVWEKDKLKELPFLKAKKWAGRALQRLFCRYGRPKVAEPEEKALAEVVYSAFVPPILNCFMGQLRIYEQGVPFPDAVLFTFYEGFSLAVQISGLYKMFKRDIPSLLLNCAFKTICLSPHDIHVFSTDPHEYANKSHDMMESFSDPRIGALNFLLNTLKYRTENTLDLILSSMTSLLEVYTTTDVKNPVHKEGALHMLCAMRKLLLSKPEFHRPIENLIVRHVFPEVQSPLGYLRARVIALLGDYSGLNWENKEHQAFTIRAAVTLLRDSELPVKLEAARAVSRFVNDDLVVAYIAPDIPAILQDFFGLVDELGNDEVISTLSLLITKVGNGVAPFALDMVRKLVNVFLQLLQEDEENDIAALTAMSSVRAINSVLWACKESKHLYPQLEPACIPYLDHLINADGMEYYEEVLEAITIFTLWSPQISEAMWNFYSRIIASFHSYAGDYLDKMVPALDNYISRGNAVLLANSNLLAQMLSIPEFLLMKKGQETESMYATKILEALLAHCRGRIDALVPNILKIVLTKLNISKSINLKLMLLDVVGLAAHYNPLLFLHSVEALGATQNTINIWLSHLPEMKLSAKHKKCALLGLSSMCLVPLSQMPSMLAQGFGAVLEQMLRMYSLIFEQQQQRQENKKEAEESDDDDESDGDQVEQFEDLGEDGDHDFNEDEMKQFTDDIEAFDADGEQEVDEEMYESPLDDVDIFISGAQGFLALSNAHSQFWATFRNSLQNNEELSTTLQLVMQQAEERSKKLQAKQG